MQTFPILIYSFCYAMVFILAWISKKEGNYRLINDHGVITDKTGNMIAFHIIGILWLGLVPVFVLKNPLLQTLTGSYFPGNRLLIIFFTLMALTAVVAIKTGKNMQQQSAISGYRHLQLPVPFITRYFIIRTVFLFAYEMWFRGYLLSDSIDAMGIPMAVTLNVLLFVLLHLFNSKKEMLACIPFGLLVCWLCILFKAAWPAVILHITFSLLYEINAYKTRSLTFKMSQP